MIADFTITVYYGEKPRRVRVKVHDNVAALRSASTQRARYHLSKKNKKKIKPERAVGLCERFHMQNMKTGKSHPLCAVVRLAPPYLGADVLAHEFCHAAVHIWQLEHQFKDAPLRCDNDEQFCFVLGELVGKATDYMWEKGVYPTNKGEKDESLAS